MFVTFERQYLPWEDRRLALQPPYHPTQILIHRKDSVNILNQSDVTQTETSTTLQEKRGKDKIETSLFLSAQDEW